MDLPHVLGSVVSEHGICSSSIPSCVLGLWKVYSDSLSVGIILLLPHRQKRAEQAAQTMLSHSEASQRERKEQGSHHDTDCHESLLTSTTHCKQDHKRTKPPTLNQEVSIHICCPQKKQRQLSTFNKRQNDHHVISERTQLP